MKSGIPYVLGCILLFAFILAACASFECQNCKELEEQIEELQWEIDDLKSEINDMYDESLDDFRIAEEAMGHLGYAEECLTGFFGSVDADEALVGINLAMDCLDEIIFE